MGIDPSLDGTAITKFVGDEFKDYWFFTEVKKLAKNNKHAIYIPQFKHQLEKLVWTIDRVTEIIEENKPDYVAIEDYAFRAIGRVFHIGGYVEGIKMFLYRKGIPIRLYEPSRVKQFTTGSGNADKPAMVLEAYKKWNVDFSDCGQYSNNVVDAYAINKLLVLELAIRNKEVNLEDCSKIIQNIFLSTTKKNKVPLIEREFIAKGESKYDSS